MDKVALSFSTNAKLEKLIGRELITNNIIAIFELIKNSYDAFAHNAIVSFEGFDISSKDLGKVRHSERVISNVDSRIIIEDDGVGISFNVYVYNVQPYVVIDYKTGENWEGDEIAEPEGKWADGTEAEPSDTKEQMYILNKNTKKFHKPECSGAKKIKAKNKGEYTGSRQTLIDEGYEPCGNCNP